MLGTTQKQEKKTNTRFNVVGDFSPTSTVAHEFFCYFERGTITRDGALFIDELRRPPFSAKTTTIHPY